MKSKIHYKKIEFIPVSQAIQMKSVRMRESPALERYKEYLLKLDDNRAGKLRLENIKEGFAIRALLKRASETLGINIKIKKVNDHLIFWKDSNNNSNIDIKD